MNDATIAQALERAVIAQVPIAGPMAVEAAGRELAGMAITLAWAERFSRVGRESARREGARRRRASRRRRATGSRPTHRIPG